MNLAEVIENLVNGNLTKAKRGAEQFSAFEIADYAEAQLGWSPEKSINAGRYLTGEGSFQNYCDIKE